MLLIENYIAPSKIHGMGLYTGVPLQKGTLVWQFNPATDHYYSHEMISLLPAVMKKYIEQYSYPYPQLNPAGVFMDADHGKFMNHSLTPNLVYDLADPSRYYAAHDIAADEELTADYSLYDPFHRF